MTFNIALNYGGRKEILDGFAKYLKENEKEELNEENFSKYLYDPNMPEVDLIIRTSGELRLSNFLIWQAAYAEYWFTETLWPDFSKEEFVQALLDYQSRGRRFGS